MWKSYEWIWVKNNVYNHWYEYLWFILILKDNYIMLSLLMKKKKKKTVTEEY